MFDFIRLACAVPDVEVGNTEFNTQEIIKYIEIWFDRFRLFTCFIFK